MQSESDGHGGPMIDKSEITIAVIGGGLGGLCLAIALGRAKYDVHLFEQAVKFSEIGAGVALGPNAIYGLQLLGILPEFEAVADISKPNAKFFDFLLWNDSRWIGEYKQGSNIYRAQVGYDHFFRSDLDEDIYRARLLEAFLPLLPQNVTTHFASRITHVENILKGSSSTGVRLTIEETHIHKQSPNFSQTCYTFEAAAAIGADGVKSLVRESLGMAGGRVRYTGTYAYRGLLPMAAAVEKNGEYARTQKMWVGPEKHLLTFPIEGGTVLNLVAFVSDRSRDPDDRVWEGPWVKPCSVEDMLSDFEDWHEDCRNLLQLIEKPDRWALHELVPLNRWTVDRITLLGDSAHASLPHNGAGAGQAIEDVYVLSELLSHPACTAATLPRFLQAYEDTRRPRAAYQQVHSRETGDYYEFAGSCGGDCEALAWELSRRYEWIWEHDLRGDIGKAVEHLRQEGVLGGK